MTFSLSGAISKIKDTRVVSQKKLDETIRQSVEDGILRHKNWYDVNERDTTDYVDHGGSESIFEQHDSAFTSTVRESRATKYRRLKQKRRTSGGGVITGVSESYDGMSVGLNTGEAPDNEQDVGKLRLQQLASKNQYLTMPPAKSIIENLKKYCIGRGISYDCPNETVDNYLSNIWEHNRMDVSLKETFRDWLMMGEVPWAFWDNTKDPNFDKENDSALEIRSLPPEQIEDVEYDIDDFTAVLSYKRSYWAGKKITEAFYLDITHPYGDESDLKLDTTYNKKTSAYQNKAEEPRMYMFKYGLTHDQRGRVFMDTVLRWNRIYVDFVHDRGRINHLRTKIFLVETLTGKNNTVGGGSRYERMPKGGIKLVENANRKYRVISPDTGAQDAELDAKLIGYLICSGVQMPMYILFQNSENNNYASIKEAGHPFAMSVQDLQDEYSERIRKIVKFFIAHGIRSKLLPPEIEMEYYPLKTIGEMKSMISELVAEAVPADRIVSQVRQKYGETKKYKIRTIDIPITLNFPIIVASDPEKTANTIKIYRELGLVSRRTAITKIGEDPEVELTRMAQEEEEDLQKSIERRNTLGTDMGITNPNDNNPVPNNKDNPPEDKNTKDNPPPDGSGNK